MVESGAAGNEAISLDCLVIIYTKEPHLLGKRFVLGTDVVSIGRGPDNQIVLDGDSISRKHACIELRHGQRILIDNNSANGTWLDESRVTQKVVVHGNARIMVGATIFKYLTGDDAEAKYYEEIYRMTIVDGLTQVFNTRHFYEALERACVRARVHGRELSVVMWIVDQYQSVVEDHGQRVADALLKATVDRLSSYIPAEHVVARCGESTFVALAENSIDAATRLAEELRAAMAQAPMEVRCVEPNFRLAQTISVGVTVAHIEHDGQILMEKASQALQLARQKGGNQVCSVKTSETLRRFLRGPMLLVRLCELSNPQAQTGEGIHLLGFEIGNEADLLRAQGSKAYERWYRQLIDDVDVYSPGDALVGVWKDRYALVGVMAPRARADEVRRWIIKAWEGRPMDLEGVPRSLRSATMSPRDIEQHGERTLDILAGELLRGVAGPDARGRELPYPIDVFAAIVSSRQTSLARVTTLANAIETILRFIVAVEFGWIRDFGEDAQRHLLVQHMAACAPFGRKLTMGDWDDLAWRLSAILPQSDDAVVVALKRLSTSSGKRSRLAEKVRSVVGLRNSLAHSPTRADNAYAVEEERLHSTLHELLEALQPLSEARLVSCSSSMFLGDEEGFECELRIHHGPLEYFPLVRVRRSSPIPNEWCSLMLGTLETSIAVCLAPFVASRVCDTCGRVEVFLADAVRLGPKGTKATLRGITTAHESRVELPGLRGLRSLFELVQRREGEGQ